MGDFIKLAIKTFFVWEMTLVFIIFIVFGTDKLLGMMGVDNLLIDIVNVFHVAGVIVSLIVAGVMIDDTDTGDQQLPPKQVERFRKARIATPTVNYKSNAKSIGHPQVQDIIKDYKDNYRLDVIADKYGISAGGIYNILRHFGVPNRERRGKNDNHKYLLDADIIAEYNKWTKLADIKTKFGLKSVSNVYNVLHRNNKPTNRNF